MAKAVLEEAPTDEIVENRPSVVAGAPMPVYGGDDDDAGLEDDWLTMEQVLLQAGAKRDRRGAWYREVPSSGPKERVVKTDPKTNQVKVYFKTPLVRRRVAVGNDWREAQAKALADTSGMTDSLMPGRGWLRYGRKLETEWPDNVGDLSKLAAVSSRYVLEEVPMDAAEQERAAALVQAASAASGSRAAAAPEGE